MIISSNDHGLYEKWKIIANINEDPENLEKNRMDTTEMISLSNPSL